MGQTALLLIDIQQGFEDTAYWGGNRNNPDAEYRAAKLLVHWRENNYPVFHVKHNSTNPSSPLVKGKKGNAIHEAVKPLESEIVYEKSVNSAFIGTALQDDLESGNIKTLVVAGMTTNHCVSTSVRMGANLGFRILLAEDATAAFDTIGYDRKSYTAQQIHEISLASLHNEFAEILSTDQLIRLY